MLEYSTGIIILDLYLIFASTSSFYFWLYITYTWIQKNSFYSSRNDILFTTQNTFHVILCILLLFQHVESEHIKAEEFFKKYLQERISSEKYLQGYLQERKNIFKKEYLMRNSLMFRIYVDIFDTSYLFLLVRSMTTVSWNFECTRKQRLRTWFKILLRRLSLHLYIFKGIIRFCACFFFLQTLSVNVC